MHGVFTILGIEFPAYFTMLTIGLMAGILLAWRLAPREGLDEVRILDLGILMIICGILGARIAHVLFDGQLANYWYMCVDPLKSTGSLLQAGQKCATDQQCVAAQLGDLCHPTLGTCHAQDCLRPLKFWYGGLTYFGGFLLCIPVGIPFLRRHKLDAWRVADLSGLGIALGLGFGRLGCFLAGCCFGEVCDLPWGVSFPPGSAAWRMHLDAHLIDASAAGSLPVHPTQLYSVLVNWGVFAFCTWWYVKKRTFAGEVFWLFAMVYSVGRFAIEMVRADERGGIAGVSTSQWIGVGVIALSFVMLRRLYLRSNPVPKPLATGPAAP